VSPTRKDIKVSDSQLDQAGRSLLQAREETTSGKVREALGKFYQRLGRDRVLPPTKDTKAVGLEEKDLEKFDQPGPWLDAWAEEKIKSGNFDSVLRVTQRLFGSSLRRNLPAVFYWQGRAHLAKGEFDAAALDLLETAVEFPASPYTPQALFWAAKAATETGRSDYARKLWLELIDSFSSSNDFAVIQLVEKARDLLHDKE
jgi:tetratricopeptide (TPR) repeat protein